MRVPMLLHDTVNPYLAARAALLLVRFGTFRSGPDRGAPIAEKIGTLAFPGLGTGVGGLSPAVCAVQMAAAIRACREPTSLPETWLEAQTRHQLLYTDRPRDLQWEREEPA